ncbi:uncharacterized protein A4U43_C08F34320 [Asparagus officinalis]|nr:uncharacterized protein A4U43_C08F34320 [Asparagus officinalis]
MAAPNLFVPYILGLFFYFSTLVVYPSSACDLVDCSALLAVKSSITSDSSGLLSTRNASTDDCCKWDGVTCDPSTGHVVNLTRPGLGDRPDDFPLDTSMSGTISPSIDDLTHLHQKQRSARRIHSLRSPHSHLSLPQNLMESHQEPLIETLDKTLEPSKESSSPTPSPSLPPQAEQTARRRGDGGGSEEPTDAKPAASEICDIEKKQRRAERFGVPFQLSEEEKRSSRAERFGTGSASSEKNNSHKLEEDKRKARAERFGLTGQSPTEEESKKKARLERFSASPIPVTPEEEEKRKARALRFSGTPNAASEASEQANSELKAEVAEAKEEA